MTNLTEKAIFNSQHPATPTSANTPHLNITYPTTQNKDLDWDLITLLRGEVSESLAKYLAEHPNFTEADRRAKAQSIISEVIRHSQDQRISQNGDSDAWSTHTIELMQKAIYDALFRLGRLQNLVDLPDVENIDINGFDEVWVEYSDGTKVKHPPIARSDAELMSEIAFLGQQGGEGARPFTAAEPRLNLDLPSGARLAAVAPPLVTRPAITIRIHRLVNIDLNDLVEKETLTGLAGNFLYFAVRTGLSIVVSGFPGAGKTTLLRALASCLDPDEKIITIESERELYLHKMPDKHFVVNAFQSRPGTGERQIDGSRPGEISLIDLLEQSLRHNASRIFVGEVRGAEIDAMFQAMQSGVGSLSTIHSATPTKAIEKMATLIHKALKTTDAYAYRQIEQHIDLIVQIAKIKDPHTGARVRRITEISEVVPGEGTRPLAQAIFKIHPGEMNLEPATRPSPELLNRLIDAGFDPTNLLPEGN